MSAPASPAKRPAAVASPAESAKSATDAGIGPEPIEAAAASPVAPAPAAAEAGDDASAQPPESANTVAIPRAEAEAPASKAESAPADSSCEPQSSSAAGYLKDPSSLRRLWDAAVRSVGQEHAMIPGLMGGAKPHANLRDMKITVELPSDADFALNTLTRADSMQWMKSALKKSFGTDVQLEYKLGSLPSQPRTGGQVAAAPSSAAPSVSAPSPVPPAPVASEPAAPVSAPQTAPSPTPAQTASFAAEPAFATAPAPATAPASAADAPIHVPEPEEPASLEDLPTAPSPAQTQPVSGDSELADILGDVFADGVIYRAPTE